MAGTLLKFRYRGRNLDRTGAMSSRFERNITMNDANRVFSVDIVVSHLDIEVLPLHCGRDSGAEQFCRLVGDLDSVDSSKFQTVSKRWWKGRTKYFRVGYEVTAVCDSATMIFQLSKHTKTYTRSRY